jgi:hypothetical protein
LACPKHSNEAAEVLRLLLPSSAARTLTVEEMSWLCTAKDIAVKSPGRKRDYAESLSKYAFPEEDDFGIEQLVENICGPARTKNTVDEEHVRVALQFIGDDSERFRKLELQLDQQRAFKEASADHDRVASTTPNAIKSLAPPGASLVQRDSNAYEGIHKLVNPSRWYSRIWEGPVASRTQIKACQIVVDLLWDAHHRAKLLPSTRPTPEQVEEAVTSTWTAAAKAKAKAAAAKPKAKSTGRGSRGRGGKGRR